MRGSSRRSAVAAVLCILAACLLAGASRAAHADDRTVSYTTWIVSNDTVMLRFVLPVAEAQRLTGVEIPVATVARVGDYILRHTAVTSAGQACPAIDQGYDLGKVDPVRAGPGLYGFEIFFRCGEPIRDLVLEDHALFGRMRGHVDFARIEVAGHFTQQIFTAGHQQLRIANPAAVPAASLAEYLKLGVLHILHSADRLCLLLAVLLLARRRRDVPWIIAALAAGYGLSGLARAAGLVAPHLTLLDAFVGFLVALCAVAIAIPQLERPGSAVTGWAGLLVLLAAVAAILRATQPALLLAGAAGFSAGFLIASRRSGHWRGLWLLPAALFGFIDGFVLPLRLAPLHLTGWTEARMSLGFDLGTLILDAGLLAAAVGVHALLRAGRMAPSRPALSVLAATGLGALGMFWLVSRLHG